MSGKFSYKEYSALAGILIGGNTPIEAQLVHRDLDPDILVNADDPYLDVNNDGIPDFRFHKEYLAYSNTLWECYSTILFEVQCLYPENSLIGNEVDGHKDVVYALQYGDPIHSLVELTPDDLQYVTMKWRELSCLYHEPVGLWWYPGIGHWASHREEDVYVGFKYYSGSAACSKYGWMRCVISEDMEQITIKDLAYNDACDLGLFAGTLTAWLPGVPVGHLPVHILADENSLQLLLSENLIAIQCSVFNLAGQIVLRHEITEAQTILSTIGLSSGVYLVQILVSDGRVETVPFYIP